MNGERQVLFFPRAARDLEELEEKYARQILEDIELLRFPPWPPAKAKKLHGTDLWELKTGDFRTLFLPRRNQVIIVRVVNRRDLLKAIKRIAVHVILSWLREQQGNG